MYFVCPFHPDTKPSLVVYKRDWHYHCFGCGKHGPALDLLAFRYRAYEAEAHKDDVLKAVWGYRLIKEGHFKEAFRLFRLEGEELREAIRQVSLNLFRR